MQARTCAFFSPLVYYFDLLDGSWLLSVLLAQPQANFRAMIEVLWEPYRLLLMCFFFTPRLACLTQFTRTSHSKYHAPAPWLPS